MSPAMATRPADRIRTCTAAVALAAAVMAGGCATSSAYHAGQTAEAAQDFDRAVVNTRTPSARNPTIAPPSSRSSAHGCEPPRNTITADAGSQATSITKRRSPSSSSRRSSILQPRTSTPRSAKPGRSCEPSSPSLAKGKTELQALIDRSRDLAPAGLELPEGAKLPDSLVFSNAGSMMVFRRSGAGRTSTSSSIPDSGTHRSPSICATSRFRMHSRQ